MKVWHRRLARPAGDDSGFGMIELIFSFVVFSIIALSVAYGLQSAIGTSGQSRNRIQAAQVAAKRMSQYGDYFRKTWQTESAEPIETLADGPWIPGPSLDVATETIDGITFDTVVDVKWQPAGGPGASACDGGTAADLPVAAVTATVTWTNMGSVQPVVSRTLLTPRAERINSSQTFVTAKVVSEANRPQAGLEVQLIGPGGVQRATTESDGCAVFSLENITGPTNYRVQTTPVAAPAPGFVSQLQTPQVVRTIQVNPRVVTRVVLHFDQGISQSFTVSIPTGFKAPVPLPGVGLAAAGTGRPISYAFRSYPASVGPLWPTGGAFGYKSWAGSCAQSAALSVAPPPLSPPGPGGSASVVLPLAGVTIRVTDSSGNPVADGAAVTATAINPADCRGDGVLNLGRTVGGQVLGALPGGEWELRVTGATPPVDAFGTVLAWPKISISSIGPFTQGITVAP